MAAKTETEKGIASLRIIVAKTWVERLCPTCQPEAFAMLAVEQNGMPASSGIKLEGDLASLRVGTKFRLERVAD